MKTLNSVCLGVALAVVIRSAFATPVRAGCGRKSKKMCMNMSAAKQDAGMTDDMPMCGMKMDDEGMKSEPGGGEAPTKSVLRSSEEIGKRRIEAQHLGAAHSV